MYAPSLYNHVDVILQPGYTPPSGNAVDAELSSPGIFFWRPSDYNHVDAELQPGYTPPSGNAADAELTRPLVTPSTAYPDGIDSESFGTASVRNQNEYLLPGGIAPSSNPVAPTVILRVQYAYVTGVAPGTIPTTHYVAHYVQYSPQNGWQDSTFGSARVEYPNREVSPPSFFNTTFGGTTIRHVLGIQPSGWQSSVVANPEEVVINTHRLYAHGWVSGSHGVQTVRNQHEYLRPSGWNEEYVGFPIVFLRDKYIYPAPYNDNNAPNFFGAASVTNKIRELRTQGHQSSRFGISTWVYNNAVPIQPSGWDSLEFGPGTFIGYENREVLPLSWDSFTSTSYTVVYNGARVLAPTSITPGSVSTPSILNLNRTISHHSGPTGEVFGTAFVAPAVRSVFPAVFNDVPAGIPDVRHNPYAILPPGIAPPQFGVADVYEHFNILRPTPTNVHPVPWVGEPYIYNVNQTVRVTPSDQSSYGLARVELSTRYLAPSGFDSLRMGAQTVMRRTRTITVSPFNPPAFPNTHWVRNDLPDPPSTQRVFPSAIFLGIEGNEGIVPGPEVRSPTIYPLGISPGLFGSTFVRRNSIEPSGIGTLEQFGTPVMIAPQYAYPKMIPDFLGGDSDREEHKSKHAVNPHTIYAPSSDQATDQARNNHPPNNPHVIDAFVGPKFGVPTISNYYREVRPTGLEFSQFGEPSVNLRKRYVYPNTWRSSRFGLAVIPFTPQEINLETYGWNSNVFGEHVVGPPPYFGPQYVYPTWITSTLFGNSEIQFKNRTVYPSSVTSNIWGLTGVYRTPLRYQMQGFIATQWGTARVEHKIRNVYPEGFDSFSSGPDLEHFADRMRVYGRLTMPAVQGIPSTLAFGTPLVSLSLRTVVAWGIAPRAFGRAQLNQLIYPSGWDSAEYGDIDRWEADKIKAHGDDMSTVGYPRLLHPLYVSAILSSEYGTPNVVSAISPTGIAPPTFAGPTLVDIYGCNNRFISPHPILPPTMPSPEVTT